MFVRSYPLIVLISKNSIKNYLSVNTADNQWMCGGCGWGCGCVWLSMRKFCVLQILT